MTPTCPTCGSIAIEKTARGFAACGNPHCDDVGVVRKARHFDPEMGVPDLSGRELIQEGGYRRVPLHFKEAS